MLDRLIQLWETIRDNKVESLPEDFTILQFGNTKEMTDDLASLVLKGDKTATSSLVQMADHLNRMRSKVGDCYLLMGSNQECLAFLEVKKTETRCFGDIDLQFAKDEGDETLENWLEIHQSYYRHQMSLLGDTLQSDTKLHCEWFKVICDLTVS